MPTTVRRDLAHLEKQGLVKRDRSGAFIPEPAMFEPFFDDLTFRDQVRRRPAEKTRIGLTAAALVRDGETIGIAPGTTATQVARFLQPKQSLTVVTSAVNVAMEISRRSDFKVHVKGGYLSGDWFALVSPAALERIPHFNLDKFFLGANGLDMEKGVTDRHTEEAAVNRAMLKQARQSILVVDHTKIRHVAQNPVCRPEQLHMNNSI